MSIIVTRYPEPPKGTSDEIIHEYLDFLLGTLSFEQFESVQTGDIRLFDVLFHMRIGNFMARPHQAIMAKGLFLRMRPRDDLKDCDLKQLHSEYPEGTLYSGLQRWMPPFKGSAASMREEAQLEKALADLQSAIERQADAKTIIMLRQYVDMLKMKAAQQQARSPNYNDIVQTTLRNQRYTKAYSKNSPFGF